MEETTSKALIIKDKRDNTQSRRQQEDHLADTLDAYETRTNTSQEISNVGADNEGSTYAGFINAEPGVRWQVLDDIHTDGRGAVATAGVVNCTDRQELLHTSPNRQMKGTQKISGVRATGGSRAIVGYLNPKEQDFRDMQVIRNVNANQKSSVVAGVARSSTYFQGLGTPISRKRTPGTSCLDLPGPRDKAVEAYSNWQQSKVVDQTLKLEYQKACTATLQDGLDLEQVFEDQAVDFYIQSGVKQGVARRFVKDIELWAEQYKSEYISEREE